jgi:phytoene dehydrogenase-like protein
MYDALIIGAGHTGLVCAAYLARAGLNVAALKKVDQVGGACIKGRALSRIPLLYVCPRRAWPRT